MAQLDPHAAAIGAAVRGAIAGAGLTRSAFAEQSGMTPRTLRRRITGTLPFTFPELVAVAEITGTPLADLVASAERIRARSAA